VPPQLLGLNRGRTVQVPVAGRTGDHAASECRDIPPCDRVPGGFQGLLAGGDDRPDWDVGGEVGVELPAVERGGEAGIAL
jgi:hypothetical protein